ncbi:MAG: ABC transporter ATP-binding protein [Ginsengibacter sp.]
MLLAVENIIKAFKKETVLKNVNFSLQQHHTLSILGKSGCGKTTLLKIIAGLVQQDNGHIYLEEKIIDQQPLNLRKIVYMSQEPLLFPHLNVFENIAFGLRLRKEKKESVEKKVTELIGNLGLQEHRFKMPHQLSGGQKQRVNFGRSLIVNPPLLLLDEPFGNLDTQTRKEMQLLFKQIATEFSISSVFVTHDIKEALLMADAIGYMKDGTLKVYDDKHSFIADDSTGVKEEISFWQSL